MVRVLPLPAPANTINGPTVCATACSCGSFSSAMEAPGPVASSAASLARIDPGRRRSAAGNLRPRMTRLEWQRLSLGARRGVVPAECACCGGVAVRTHPVSDGAEQHLLIGY